MKNAANDGAQHAVNFSTISSRLDMKLLLFSLSRAQAWTHCIARSGLLCLSSRQTCFLSSGRRVRRSRGARDASLRLRQRLYEFAPQNRYQVLNKNVISDTIVKLRGGRPEGLAQNCSGVRLDAFTVMTGPENGVHAAGAIAACLLNLNCTSVYRPNDIGSPRVVDVRAGHFAGMHARTT